MLKQKLEPDIDPTVTHRALALWWSMIPRVEPEGVLFGKPDSTHRVKARGQAFPDHALVRAALTLIVLRQHRHASLRLVFAPCANERP